MREAVHERAFAMIGLSRTPPARAVPSPRPREKAPMHAAAVLLAVGLLRCGETTSGIPADGAVEAANAGAGGYMNQGGVMEAPPPPMGGGNAGVGGASAGAGGAGGNAGVAVGGAGGAVGGTGGTGGYVNQGGVMEAPPPWMWGGNAGIGGGGNGGIGGDSGVGDAKADGSDGSDAAGGSKDSGSGGFINQGGVMEAPPPPMGGNGGR
jgi:hypothetical protein